MNKTNVPGVRWNRRDNRWVVSLRCQGRNEYTWPHRIADYTEAVRVRDVMDEMLRGSDAQPFGDGCLPENWSLLYIASRLHSIASRKDSAMARRLKGLYLDRATDFLLHSSQTPSKPSATP